MPTWGGEGPSRALPVTLPKEDAGDDVAEDNEEGET